MFLFRVVVKLRCPVVCVCPCTEWPGSALAPFLSRCLSRPLAAPLACWPSGVAKVVRRVG